MQSYPATPTQSDHSYPKPQQNGGGVRPSQQGRPKNKPQQTRPVQKRPQKQNYPKRPQTSRPVNNNRQQSGNQGNSQGGALGAPSVMCPSAMLCVPKPNCDFKGLITDIPLNNLSPELEALRVPYISCVNPQDPSDASTVCCRDPNYKDPWPNMNGGGGGGKNKNMNNRNNGNGGGYEQNRNNGNGIQPRNGGHSNH